MSVLLSTLVQWQIALAVIVYTGAGVVLTNWLKDFILDRFKQPVSVLLSFPVFVFHVFFWPVVLGAIIFQIIKNSRSVSGPQAPSVFFADRAENINPTTDNSVNTDRR